ncbi:long-chain-fatty-acid--CoA ligase [Nocardioides sp. NPDC051685]|uniref:long-chain-fatty-acid--CoA ligase n=1 Tax=Nocardioides sp. NPDC051685 TaxID=3364334 RepID=UPI00378AF22C
MSMAVTPNGIFEIVERQVSQKPDAAALVFGDQTWTWTELHDRILRLAGSLRAAGITEGDRIATLDKNHPACLETTFAASLLGAAHAVINFRLSREELAYVIADSAAEILIVGAEFVEAIADIRAELPKLKRIVVLGGDKDEYEGLVASGTPLTDRHDAKATDCFLQLYTSGTTGWPKGAMLSQGGLAAHSEGLLPAYRMDESTVNLVAMPLFHVGGTSWAIGGMYAGGLTIVAREAVPADLLATIRDHQVTHAFFVPALIQMLLAQDDIVEATKSLQVIGYGGSPMPAPLMDKTLATLSTPLYSVYGMTEMSGVFCVLGPDDHRNPERPQLRASAGRPLPGSEVRVVNPSSGKDSAPGEVGEFWVKSPQMMIGYWNKPEATAETIVDGWLRTGDAGRIDEDGYLYVEDRVKEMVITGGENVYPAEVERVLIQHPAVAEVAVIGLPDEKWGETVHAVVTPESGSKADAAELIAYARQRLAHYKCPTGVTFVDILPRNATGKILKRNLKAKFE